MIVVEVVAAPAASGAQPVLRLSAADGRACEISINAEIRQPRAALYQEVIGLPSDDQKKRFTARMRDVLLLLILARLAPSEVEALGYGPAPGGRLQLAAVGQLRLFKKYGDAAHDSKTLKLLQQNLRSIFPLHGAVQIDRGPDPAIWLDTDCIEVRGAAGTVAALAAHLRAAKRPPEDRYRVVLQVSGMADEELKRAVRRINALLDKLLLIRRGQAGVEAAEALKNALSRFYRLLDILLVMLAAPGGADVLQEVLSAPRPSSRPPEGGRPPKGGGEGH